MSRSPAPGRPPSPAPGAAGAPVLGRRALLRAAGLGGGALAAAALAGCSTPWGELRVQPLDGDPAPAPLPPDADELARRDALARARGLSDAVTAAAGTGGDAVAAVLLALTTTLVEQRVALGEVAGGTATQDGPTADAATGAATGAGTADPTATPTAAPSAVPAGLDALVQGFADAGSGALAGLEDVSASLARLLASLAAGHLVAATALARAAGLAAPVDLAAAGAGTGTDADTDTDTDTDTSKGTDAAAAPDAAEVAALATALDAEGAAVYGYGVLAVHLAGDERTGAVEALALHDAAADALEATISATGTTPDPPTGAYALPAPVTDRTSALALAVALEDGGCAARADLVGASAPPRRAGAAEVLRRRALAADAWRRVAGTPEALPALPGLSGR